MIKTPQHSDETQVSGRSGETGVRLFVLGAVYALAIFVVVAFSPAVGLVSTTPHPHGPSLANHSPLAAGIVDRH